jgi:hypothetical protein
MADLAGRGHDAILSLARRLGLPCEEPVVLSSRGNLVVHLAPAPVVARAATLSGWSRGDPYSWLAREVAVAGYVSSRGGPVVPPARRADPGPHWQNGFAISLWDYVPAVDSQPGPAEVGAALAELHLAARDCPADLGEMSPARELISDGLQALSRHSVIDADAIAALRAAHGGALSALAGAGCKSAVLHGDTHGGNLLRDSRRGWLWIDLEDTCRGPAEWDLATLSGRYGADDAAAALRSYAAGSGTPVPDAAALEPFCRARELEGAVWSLCMARLYPARYRDVAQALLDTVLAQWG